MHSIFVVLFLSTFISTNLSQDIFFKFRNVTEYERIINGKVARKGQFPWQVAVFHRSRGRRRFCGGALISERWVLTAGHCVLRASDFHIHLGSLTIFNEDEPGKIVLGARRAILHPFYRARSLGNDVALLELEKDVEFNDQIQAIRLPSRGSYLPSKYRVTVSGWGKKSDFATSISNRLYFNDLMTISNHQCRESYNPFLIRRNVLCCNSQFIRSTCNGDSGGPLVIKDFDGEATHVGVVSFVSNRGCAKGYPSGFMRTASFLDFIEEETGIGARK